MISNQIIQSAIDGLKSITRKDITVVERDGKVVASTDYSIYEKIKDAPALIEAFLNSQAENQSIHGYQYFKVIDNNIAEYVVVLTGDDEDNYLAGRIATFHLQSLVQAYKERFDRENFFKSLLLDNLLLVDIYSRAKRLKIESNIRRVVYSIETSFDEDDNAIEVIRGMFPNKQRDFVTAVDEKSIILIKEIAEADTTEEIEAIAESIVDTLNTEAMIKAHVAIGTAVNDLKNVSMSFKEARLAQDVGNIFDEDKQVINYEHLGIGRLIYQLPISLCQLFVKEMLQGFSIDDIDEEMFTTVAKFFENDLNVSETSRELWIHRNTLVYRLDKLEKMTRLDLRKFSDAITFKITLMVNRYMQYRERQQNQ